MTTRRDFLKMFSAMTAGAVLAPSLLSCNRGQPLIGIQLYTLRQNVGKETLKVLQQLSNIGYNNIEAYGFDGKFFGMQPKEFKKMVNDLNMQLTCSHTNVKIDTADKIFGGAAEAGMEYIVQPSMWGRPSETVDEYKVIADEFNKLGEIAKKHGVKFGFHNHAHEFKKTDDIVHYDVLLNETDKDLVTYELDMYWIVRAGFNPIQYFNKYPGRFELWHLKDRAKTGETEVVGNGTIDFKEIFKYKNKAGMKHFYVEQEQYKDKPIKCVEQSFNYIKNNLV